LQIGVAFGEAGEERAKFGQRGVSGVQSIESNPAEGPANDESVPFQGDERPLHRRQLRTKGARELAGVGVPKEFERQEDAGSRLAAERA
jgi:hypothetical protein